MHILDVNVLVGACFQQAVQHTVAIEAIRAALDSEGGLGLTSVAVSGLVRVSLQTYFRDTPSRVPEVLDFAGALQSHPKCRAVEPGEGHWKIFYSLVHPGWFGNRAVTDAWFAALAMEHDATFVSFDGGFSQFRDLRWVHLKS